MVTVSRCQAYRNSRASTAGLNEESSATARSSARAARARQSGMLLAAPEMLNVAPKRKPLLRTLSRRLCDRFLLSCAMTRA